MDSLAAAPNRPLAAAAAKLGAYFKPAFTLDLRSLAVFRIVMGLVHLGVALWRLHDAEALYSDAGVLPRVLALQHVNLPWAFQLHFLYGSTLFEQALMALHVLAALAMIFGWKTRWATALCWALALGERERNLLAADGGDDLMVLGCFFGAFLPLGARFSLDARRTPQPTANAVFSAGSVGLVVQLCCVYFFSTLLKSGATWRVDHSALWWALSLDSFATPLATHLRQFPELCRVLTRGTFGLEFFGPLLLLLVPRWPKLLRTGIAVGFIALHLGIAACLHLPHFSAAAIALWLAVLPGAWWDALQRRPAPGMTREVPRLPLAARALAIAAIALILSSNLASLPTSSPQPPAIHAVTQALGLSQGWTMFTPNPLEQDGWYVFDARLADGRQLDLRTGAPTSFARPSDLADTYADVFWRNQLMNIRSKALGAPFFPTLAKYLCGRWNDAHAPSERAETLDVDFMLEVTRPGEPAPPAVKQALFHASCAQPL